jgi:hypothetical protein
MSQRCIYARFKAHNTLARLMGLSNQQTKLEMCANVCVSLGVCAFLIYLRSPDLWQDYSGVLPFYCTAWISALTSLLRIPVFMLFGNSTGGCYVFTAFREEEARNTFNLRWDPLAFGSLFVWEIPHMCLCSLCLTLSMVNNIHYILICVSLRNEIITFVAVLFYSIKSNSSCDKSGDAVFLAHELAQEENLHQEYAECEFMRQHYQVHYEDFLDLFSETRAKWDRKSNRRDCDESIQELKKRVECGTFLQSEDSVMEHVLVVHSLLSGFLNRDVCTLIMGYVDYWNVEDTLVQPLPLDVNNQLSFTSRFVLIRTSDTKCYGVNNPSSEDLTFLRSISQHHAFFFLCDGQTQFGKRDLRQRSLDAQLTLYMRHTVCKLPLNVREQCEYCRYMGC